MELLEGQVVRGHTVRFLGKDNSGEVSVRFLFSCFGSLVAVLWHDLTSISMILGPLFLVFSFGVLPGCATADIKALHVCFHTAFLHQSPQGLSIHHRDVGFVRRFFFGGGEFYS